MFKARIKPLALTVTLCAAGPAMLARPVYAANLQEKVTVTPAKTISPQEEAVISSAGVKVLRHIAQARADIRAKELQDAGTELGQAEKLLDIIQAALPTSQIKDRIWIAKKHLEYENTQEVLPDLIPIYASLDELIDIMPTDTAKHHLDEARNQLKSGDKEKAKQALEATSGALQYTEVDLPLGTTRQLVAQANADLKQEKPGEADKALKAAEDSVVYLSVALQQPLFRAKTLLWQALLDMQAGHRDAASSALQQAVVDLTNASRSDDKATRDAASEILAQARQLQDDLEGGTDIAAGLRRLWQHTEALADRSVEYLADGWARYRAGSPLKSELIEAKLHLAFARIDLFTGHEPARAAEELRVAGRFLDQAAETVQKQKSDAGYQQEIADLQKAVERLSGDPAAGEEARYAGLQEQLHDMIRSL